MPKDETREHPLRTEMRCAASQKIECESAPKDIYRQERHCIPTDRSLSCKLISPGRTCAAVKAVSVHNRVASTGRKTKKATYPEPDNCSSGGKMVITITTVQQIMMG